MSQFSKYSPLNVLANFKGVPITGYASGTFIEAQRESDSFEMSAGAGGDVVRVQKPQRNGTVTLTLQAESPTNDLLSAIFSADELFGNGIGRFMLKDLNGNTLLESTYSWIRRMPNVTRTDSGNNVEWMIDCHELIGLIGGALSPV